MLPSKRQFLADEELGKKDDDHRPRANREHFWLSRQWKPPRRRRFLWGFIASCLIYVLLRNITTGLAPASERYNPVLSQERQQSPTAASFPQEPPPRDESVVETNNEYYYEGQIRLISLAKTLQRFQNPQSRYWQAANRVVMFSAASLKAVSDLLPLACNMARQQLNEVHFVLMGRDDVDCRVNWHDARPDYAQWSTDPRMEEAALIALGYLQFYLRPQVLITQGTMLEDSFFSKGVESGAQRHGITHILLPGNARDLMWMSLLDSSALRDWNNLKIELLIQAPSKSSGSLIRLLRSLEEADYLGTTPGLTIELPQDVDSQLLGYLREMKGPFTSTQEVTLRRHIQRHTLRPTEASLKTVEAFYPRDPNTSHVLMISPQTELSPSFYHYLKYTILKYRYPGGTGHSYQNLFGISLELPSLLPTNEEPFTPPETDASFTADHNIGESLPLFLWQAPNTNAALYFGDKWVEFHSFLSKRLTLQEGTAQDPLQGKVISKKYPAVMEYLLELMRARGYYMLYPAFEAKGSALATVHNELYQAPEEFTPHGPSKLPDGEAIDDDLPLPKQPAEKPVSRAFTLMTLLDRVSMSLPALDTMPLLSYTGHETSPEDWGQNTRNYIQEFRSRHGSCSTQSSADPNSISLFSMDEGYYNG